MENNNEGITEIVIPLGQSNKSVQHSGGTRWSVHDCVRPACCRVRERFFNSLFGTSLVTSVQSCTGPPLRAAATREERGEEVGRVELIRLPSGSRRQTDTESIQRVRQCTIII